MVNLVNELTCYLVYSLCLCLEENGVERSYLWSALLLVGGPKWPMRASGLFCISLISRL